MIVSSDDLGSVQPVYIKHVHRYSDSWPISLVLLGCISHTLSVSLVDIYVYVTNCTGDIHTIYILVNKTW